MFVYCKKCGLIKSIKSSCACPACDILMESVPKEYLSSSGLMFASRETRKAFEDHIKQNPEFDEEISIMRDDIINKKESQRKEQIEEKIAEYNESRIKFTCPICHSERISKISNLGKFVKVSAFGILGAGDIGKKYKCNTCGYKF